MNPKVVLSPKTQELLINIKGKQDNLIYKVDTSDAGPLHIEFFGKILSLLEGRNLHKRLGSSGSLKRENYNPLKGKTPKQLGFGERYWRLSQDLKFLEICHLNTLRIENRIRVSDLHKVVIPSTTEEIVAIQKKERSETGGDTLISAKDKPVGKFQKQKRLVKDKVVTKAIDVDHFPFTLILKEGSIDIVTNSYGDYRDMTQGFKALVHQMKNLRKLAKRISV